MNDLEFGDMLRAMRSQAELSQEELAERAAISVEAIRALERGRRRAPYRHTVDSLATALQLTAEKREEFAKAARRERRARPAGLPAIPASADGDQTQPKVVVEESGARIVSLRTILIVSAAALVFVICAAAIWIDRPEPSLRRVAGRAACVGGDWVQSVTNNTHGFIEILSGTGSFAGLSPSAKEVHVRPAGTVRGIVSLRVRNEGSPFSIAPLILTPSWGEPRDSWAMINHWVPVGNHVYSRLVFFTVPDKPGIYHILFAFQLEMSADNVASGTNWGLHQILWNPRSNLANFDSGRVWDAQHFGCAISWWQLREGLVQIFVPADAITLTVS